MTSISKLISDSTKQLESTSESPRLDAEVLLCFVLEKDRSYLLTWPEKEIDSEHLNSFNELIAQRKQGIPIAHLTGQKEFWSLNLNVTKDTLIPRPETELLVEQILETYPDQSEKKLLDLGTGTGAIALAIASERPHWKITATDESLAALEIAKKNAEQLQLDNINFLHGSWLNAIAEKQFDIIVSNPPYIPSDDPHLGQGDVRFEPSNALASGIDGLDAIREIASEAFEHLKSGGMLVVEHGYDQKDNVYEIFMKNGYKSIKQTLDLAKNPRTTLGIKS